MAMQENRPNIVVDENFLMLEKRLRRRYAERASAYSNADAIEQERNGARAFAIAPQAYGDSKFIGGINSFKSGTESGVKYMTTDDYVAYFGRCHDTFGAMSIETVAPVDKIAEEEPRVLVNRKKVEQIRKINEKEAARANRKRGVKKTMPTAKRPVEQKSQHGTAKEASNSKVKLDSGKLEVFFTKLSAAKGRALASVAAFAVCCTLTVGGIVALVPNGSEPSAASADMMRTSEVVEQAEEEAHANLLSTLE